MADLKEKITVIHSFPIWLPQTQTWMYNQVRYLPEDRIENHIVCERTENLEQFRVPNIHCAPEFSKTRYLWDKILRKFRIRRHLGFLTDMIKKHKAQVLHSHFGNVGWANLGAVRQTGVRHVVTFYGQDVNRLPQTDSRWLMRYRQLFKNVDKILCEGPHMAQCIVKLGCPEHKVHVHHLGVKTDKIEFKPRVWKPVTPLRVLIAATFREKKGIPYAIEALGKLQYDVPLEITIIGDAKLPDELEEKKRILSMIEKYNLQEKVRMMGYQPYCIFFEEAYKHHIFLSPSITASNGDTEGGAPVSIIEMAATGMPIISTNHCDIPNVIMDGATGLLAEEHDMNGLLNHLKWLTNCPEKWFSMIQAGRKHVADKFNTAIQGEKLAFIYNK